MTSFQKTASFKGNRLQSSPFLDKKTYAKDRSPWVLTENSLAIRK